MDVSLLLFALLACSGDEGPGTSDTGPTIPGDTAPPADTAAPVADLDAPTEVALERRDGGLIVTWSNVPGADRHDVFLATAAGVTPRNVASQPGGIRIEAASSPLLVEELANGETIYVVVAGILDDVAGPPSSEVFATLDCAPGECVCTEALAVGYDVDNNTCGFLGLPGSPDLPQLSLDEWHYNTLFGGTGYGGPFGADGGAFQEAGESRGCGACLEVTGPLGTLVGIVTGIADVAAVNNDGLPTSVLVRNDVIGQVRPGQGRAVDVVVRPVSCPVTGTIRVQQQIFGDFPWRALYYRVYNHAEPIASVEIRAETGHDQWYPLVPDWNGRFVGNEDAVNPVIPIPDPEDGPFRLRLTSIAGEVLTSDPITADYAQPDFAYYDTGVQFAARQVLDGTCSAERVSTTCGNRTVEAGEQCEIGTQASTGCATLGAGTGTAVCDPDSCQWDTRDCVP